MRVFKSQVLPDGVYPVSQVRTLDSSQVKAWAGQSMQVAELVLVLMGQLPRHLPW